MARSKLGLSENSLESAVKLIRSSMAYIDGTADVSFTVAKDGTVSKFKLTNNLDAPKANTEYVPEDDGFNNFYGTPK